MRLKISLSVLFAILTFASAIDEYTKGWMEVSRKILSNDTLLKEWNRNLEIFDQMDGYNFPPFTCDVELSPTPPTTVNELRPSDINVLAAYGDSITAGNGLGADNLIEVAVQNRGESWAIGGDLSLEEGVLTLTNIMRKYNRNVKGYSIGEGWVEDPESWLNVAVPGARSRNIPEQTEDLIMKLNNDARIDVANDWKMVTLFIGGNDICKYCDNPEDRSPEMYIMHIRNSLDRLYEAIPRVLVHLVPMFDVSPLRFMSTGLVCDLLHQQFCHCAIEDDTRPDLRPLQVAYFDEMKKLADSGRYERDDFTVVLQPHMRDMKPPVDGNGEVDHSYFSPDCFHPGRKGHQGIAYMLYNTMLVPVGEKPVDYDITEVERFYCPTPEKPYIFTNRNSGTDFKITDFTLANKEAEAYAGEAPIDENNTPTIVGSVVGGVVGVCVVAALIATVIVAKKKMALKGVQHFENPVFEPTA